MADGEVESLDGVVNLTHSGTGDDVNKSISQFNLISGDEEIREQDIINQDKDISSAVTEFNVIQSNEGQEKERHETGRVNQNSINTNGNGDSDTKENGQQINAESDRKSDVGTVDSHIDMQTYEKLLAEKKKLTDELKRLKDHLITVEDEYTQEVLAAEERESQANRELNKAMATIEQLMSRLSEDQSPSWSEKLENLQKERDKALDDVSKLDDKVHRLTASVTNLQLVIEQMQKENEKKLSNLAKQHQTALETERAIQNDLRREVEVYEKKSLEAAQALQAATRLTENIDQKEEMIQNLKQELSEKDSKISDLEAKITDLKSTFEGKVDKQIIKNLILGYFGTPNDKKHEVERLLARILDFNQEEMSRAGLSLSRPVKHGSAAGNASLGASTSVHHHQSTTLSAPSFSVNSSPGSLSKMFVEFLEAESRPKASATSQNSTVTRELARDLTKVALTPNVSKVNLFSEPSLGVKVSPISVASSSRRSSQGDSLGPSPINLTNHQPCSSNPLLASAPSIPNFSSAAANPTLASLYSPPYYTPYHLVNPSVSTATVTTSDNHLLVEPSVSTLSPIRPVTFDANNVNHTQNSLQMSSSASPSSSSSLSSLSGIATPVLSTLSSAPPPPSSSSSSLISPLLLSSPSSNSDYNSLISNSYLKTKK